MKCIIFLLDDEYDILIIKEILRFGKFIKQLRNKNCEVFEKYWGLAKEC
jgi:hypothetical protein